MLEFGLDETLVGLLLVFEEADVVEGHAEDSVNGGGEEVGEGVRVLGDLVEFAGALPGILEMTP